PDSEHIAEYSGSTVVPGHSRNRTNDGLPRLLQFQISGPLPEDYGTKLETKPLSMFTPENVYVDKAGMDALLLSLRKNLRHDFYGSANELTNELITSDCAVAGNKETSATHNFFTQVTPTGTGQYNFFTYWNNAYDQIRNANVVISRIDAPEWETEQDKNEILGEAYFPRAYWYF